MHSTEINNADTNMIAARGLAYAYGQRWIFRHLDFDLQAGALTAILGPNGCGKSTLLAVLSGGLKPMEGEIRRHDQGLAMVPQSLAPTLPFKGLDIVLLGRARNISLFAAPRQADYDAAHAALTRLNAAHLAERAFDVMSGGERQLVLIARALAAECPVILLDEPTAALDWQHQAHVLNLLRQLADEGLTIAFTTHAPQHALDFADRVMLMAAPEQQITGIPDAVLSETALSNLYRLPVRRLSLDGTPCSTAIPVFRKNGNEDGRSVQSSRHGT